ncbi:hypothetical protein F2Q68_00002301 [Brassica cretica]|uniref:Reticulon domain-containing protein n=1 Tax=Brassica cretica TaxID=69181 RepID=A0A8S9JDJ8_BRACR|nr:hypothetical protein F2Q68_00002301 [Brassica cretica]
MESCSISTEAKEEELIPRYKIPNTSTYLYTDRLTDSSMNQGSMTQDFVTSPLIAEALAIRSTLVLLFTVPLVYDKYEDKVDSYGEKAMAELKKQYAVLDEKVLSKIPRGPSKDKKKD